MVGRLQSNLTLSFIVGILSRATADLEMFLQAIDKTSIEEIVLPDNFMSTLTVRKATAKDTGRYFCKYLDSVREPGSADGVRSIYVFVNGEYQNKSTKNFLPYVLISAN